MTHTEGRGVCGVLLIWFDDDQILKSINIWKIKGRKKGNEYEFPK